MTLSSVSEITVLGVVGVHQATQDPPPESRALSPDTMVRVRAHVRSNE